jgi:hypothetical protein
MPAAPRTKRNPRDFTGNQKAILSEQAAKQVAARQDEISMINAQERAAKEQPIELDARGREVRQSEADVSESDPVPIQVAPEFATVRINCTLEKVTIGQDNHFDFVEGQVYRLPYHVAAHLDALGYVWQWL